MALYGHSSDKLSLIKEKRFSLEKDIQNIVEENLTEIFGLEFVASERIIGGLRIDTLAYDSDAKTFVIIEYKRDTSFSVVDQGFSYLSLLLNNKADFVLEYNEVKNLSLRRDDIDWSQSRIIFISPNFTVHQVNAINFKNIPFELWEIKQFENGTVSFSEIKRSDATEKMPGIETKPETQKIAKEVVEYSEESFFENRPVSQSLYQAFREKISGMYPELIFDPKKSSINVKHRDNWRVVVYINVYMEKLRLLFTRSTPKDFQDPQNKLVHEYTKADNKNQDLTRIDIYTQEDIDYVVALFQQAYARYKKDFIER